MIKFTLNGKECFAEENEYLLGAAKRNGIEIPSLCDHPSVRIYGACGVCLVEVEGVPKLLRACSTKVTDGMVVSCETERVRKARKIALELLMSEHDGDCIGPCKLNCPASTDCQGYIKKISLGDYHGAVEIIKDKLPLPASIGRICPHPCEKKCRRANVEAPLSIAALKAFAADRDLEKDTYRAEKRAATGKNVAIVGGGPAGLTAAYFLSLKGHAVKLYDAMPKMGGMLRYGIPAYRLPKDVLDREIWLIRDTGVEFINNVKIGRDVSLDSLREENDAVILAVGAWKSSSMRIVGEDLDGVVGGIDILRAAALYNEGSAEKPDLTGKRVVICGGGNTAMDACRSAVRLGAESVTVVYRRTRSEMPADPEEIKEAEEEGVCFKFLCNPAELTGHEGKLTAIRLQIMELGEPDASGRRSPVAVEGKFETLDADVFIEAIGQTLDFSADGLEYNRRGYINAHEELFATTLEKVFAIGDATNRGASIAIEAIGEANRAAEVVDSFLCGAVKPCRKPYVSERKLSDIDFSVYEKKERYSHALRDASERRNDFLPVALPLDEERVKSEASRCLECGCHDYAECKLIKTANHDAIKPERLAGKKNVSVPERTLISIERNNSKCILCSLCVRTCTENTGKSILGLVGRGFDTVVKAEFTDSEIIKGCRDCHLCVDVCPTGALKLL